MANKTNYGHNSVSELYLWTTVPRDKAGKQVKSLEELTSVIPANPDFSPIAQTRKTSLGMPIYGRIHVKLGVIEQDFAYYCPKCESIVIGPPIIDDSNATYCSRCKSPLEKGSN
jgi:hypothetical protein